MQSASPLDFRRRLNVNLFEDNETARDLTAAVSDERSRHELLESIKDTPVPSTVIPHTVSEYLFGCVIQHDGINPACTPECIQGLRDGQTPECDIPIYIIEGTGVRQINPSKLSSKTAYLFVDDSMLKNDIDSVQSHVATIKGDGLSISTVNVYTRPINDVKYRRIDINALKRAKDASDKSLLSEDKPKKHDNDGPVCKKDNTWMYGLFFFGVLILLGLLYALYANYNKKK